MNFTGSANGNQPYGSLISDGTFLYGMTEYGGINNKGVIFKIKRNGTGYTKLFDSAGTTIGSYPLGSLISDGTFLYGTTDYGGINNKGVIFKIKPDGTGYAKLLDFAGATNGDHPNGTLISDGTYLYGTAEQGGTNGSGTIFKIKLDGTGFTKLLDFDGDTLNGNYPLGSLISDGTFLYGTTWGGGTNDWGVIYKIKPDGTDFTKLFDFDGTNGMYPYCSLLSVGNFLYGTAEQGGANSMGVVFKIKSDGTGYTKLIDFSGVANGQTPYGSLFSDGTFLYGMTSGGGTIDSGTVFKIKPDGTGFSKLLNFAGPSNGSTPNGSFISDGTFLYGMTSGGGANHKGTIFK